jgi:hypothetical protein
MVERVNLTGLSKLLIGKLPWRLSAGTYVVNCINTPKWYRARQWCGSRPVPNLSAHFFKRYAARHHYGKHERNHNYNGNRTASSGTTFRKAWVLNAQQVQAEAYHAQAFTH